MITEQEQLVDEFDQLTPEEVDLYYKAFCFYCGRRLEISEYGNHVCASLGMLRGYFKEEEF